MRRLLAMSALLLAAAACRGGEASQPAGGHEAEEHGSPRELRVAPATQAAWGIGVEPARMIELAPTLTLPGVVGVNQERTAYVTTPLEGRVASVGAGLGRRVGRGEALLMVEAPALSQARSAFLQALGRRNLAKRELDRARALVQQEVIQQREVQRREAEYDEAATEVGLLESNLHSFGISQPEVDAMVDGFRRQVFEDAEHRLTTPAMRVVSPIAGQVIQRDVIAGEFVKPDKTLFTVSDLDELWADLDARENDLPALARGGAVALSSAVYPGRSFSGRILQVGDVVDEKLRTIKVRVALDNRERLLRPNMFVQGRIDTRAPSRRVLAVPEQAVQTIEGEPVVFVRIGEGLFAARVVARGEQVGPLRIVTGGLTEGEAIVVAGAFNLKAELLKGTLAGEGGH